VGYGAKDKRSVGNIFIQLMNTGLWIGFADWLGND
jgi:hypothetical protein